MPGKPPGRKRESMFNKNSLLVPVALYAGALSMSTAYAQVTAACPYSLASFQGTYSVVTNYGANVAISMGTWTFDGNGNLAGPSIVNEPTAGSATGARTIV